MTEETLGSHIYAILSSYVFIKDSYFLDAISKLGGALYIEGNSTVDVEKTTFQNNWAKRQGGAIYASGFNRLKVRGRSEFINNLANEAGDDIYVSRTEGIFELEGTSIMNP
jgi:predicted outer membrane repeat protein